MEALYAKLYNKYDTLKKRRFSELDGINKDQEVKFLNYVSAAEELIQHLRDENDRLRGNVSDLRNEVESIRSTKDEQCAQYQKMLLEENQKNRELSEEVGRLEKVLQERLLNSPKDGNHDKMHKNFLQSPQIRSGEVSAGSQRRIRRKLGHELAEMESAMTAPGSGDQDNAAVREAAEGSIKGIHQLPECCKRTVDEAANCQFQALIEYLLGMKLSAINQTDGICISALHQSSGYSFSLTWVKKADKEEPELLYRVLTLGTFEMVAPEWMRSVILFSRSMCPIFFERVTKVIKLHH